MTLQTRVQQLVAQFRHIGATRMDGVPVLHPGLQVAAVGFEPDAANGGAVGVLLTPWFMNLVWMPPQPAPADAPPPLRVGELRVRNVGNASFDFIGAHEDGIGAFEACSLFSPMFEFEDQAAALATAQAVLDQLRALPEPEPVPAPVPARRRFLLGGRGAAA